MISSCMVLTYPAVCCTYTSLVPIGIHGMNQIYDTKITSGQKGFDIETPVKCQPLQNVGRIGNWK